MNECPCGSQKSYAKCCEPLIKSAKVAKTAEELMRSRYSAYVNQEIGYLHDTMHPDFREDWDEQGTKKWAKSSEWNGLKIVETQKGKAGDEEGTVEFIAYYTQKGNKLLHHELASFAKVDGKWFFKDGKMVKQKTVVREEPKVGRNDPCPCGSGKKFKKCCGIEA